MRPFRFEWQARLSRVLCWLLHLERVARQCRVASVDIVLQCPLCGFPHVAHFPDRDGTGVDRRYNAISTDEQDIPPHVLHDYLSGYVMTCEMCHGAVQLHVNLELSARVVASQKEGAHG